MPTPHDDSNNTAPELLAGFAHIPLYRSDLLQFAGEVGCNPRMLWAIHRDGRGRETGREIIYSGRRHRFAFTPGGTKSLFRTPGSCRKRLVLADGPLAAICLAALEGPRVAAASTYAAPGGPLTRAATEALTELIQSSPPSEIVLAFGPTPDGSCRSREVCEELLAGLPLAQFSRIEVMPPGPGGWVEVLRGARTRRRAA